MHATRAAVEEGIVPGGGVASGESRESAGRRESRYRSRMAIPTSRSAFRSCVALWKSLSARSFRMPAKKAQSLSSKYATTRTTTSASMLQTEEYEDLVKAGVIDPAKVTRTALQNAASIAGLMLTTEAMVSEIPEEDKAPMPGGMGGMGGGMGM